MRSNFLYRPLIYLICIFSILQKAQAQSDVDSLYSVGIMNVYDNPDKAIEISNQIIENSSKDLSRKIDGLLLRSNAYSSKRDYEQSLKFALEAKKISLNLKDNQVHLRVLSGIAAKYHQLGVDDKTLLILDEADALAERIVEKDSIRFVMGNNFAIRGFVYRNQLTCDIAIEYFNRADQAFSAFDTERSAANRSVTAYNKGNCFVTLNQLDSAKINYQKAGDLAMKIQAKSLLAFSLKGLAEVYTLESRYDEAIETLLNAQDLSKDVGDLVLNREINKGLADNYLAKNNWQNFQYYNGLYESDGSQIKISERKTIHNILDNHSQEVENKDQNLRLKYGISILITGIALILVSVLLILSEFSFQKALKKLKNKIKF